MTPMLARRRTLNLLWLLLAFAVVGCDGRSFVDGVPIGQAADCSEDCGRFVQTAEAWLDDIAPGHPDVVAIEAFHPNYRIRMARSGGRDLVMVIRLEDDSSRAVLVGCGRGIDPDPCFAWQPPGNADGDP